MGCGDGVPLGMSRLRPDQRNAEPGNRTCVAADVLLRDEPDDDEEEEDDDRDREQDDEDHDDGGGYSVSEALLRRTEGVARTIYQAALGHILVPSTEPSS